RATDCPRARRRPAGPGAALPRWPRGPPGTAPAARRRGTAWKAFLLLRREPFHQPRHVLRMLHVEVDAEVFVGSVRPRVAVAEPGTHDRDAQLDRKSTRLN